MKFISILSILSVRQDGGMTVVTILGALLTALLCVWAYAAKMRRDARADANPDATRTKKER